MPSWRFRFALCFALTGLLGFLGGLGLSACDPRKPAAKFHGMVIDQADFGRDFQLNAPDGQPRRLSDFRGQAVVIFFGYTQCPDICPTTLSTLAEAMHLLGKEANRVQVLFVTLDPQRDTRELLASYVPRFHPDFLGLSGDEAATAAVAREFRVYYLKRPGSTPGSYSLDHTANIYLYDPQGRLRLAEKQGETAETIAADLRLLLAGQ